MTWKIIRRCDDLDPFKGTIVAIDCGDTSLSGVYRDDEKNERGRSYVHTTSEGLLSFGYLANPEPVEIKVPLHGDSPYMLRKGDTRKNPSLSSKHIETGYRVHQFYKTGVVDLSFSICEDSLSQCHTKGFDFRVRQATEHELRELKEALDTNKGYFSNTYAPYLRFKVSDILEKV